MRIKIFYENINFRLKDWKKIKKLIEKVISEEGNFSGDLNFILADDKLILKINSQFLKHNYHTDVISFNYNQGKNNLGEIYISIETVKSNSQNYKVSYKDELLRVMIHGVLHLCGLEDNTPKEKEVIHMREDHWIKAYKKRTYGF